jgi:hypothetical protein
MSGELPRTRAGFFQAMAEATQSETPAQTMARLLERLADPVLALTVVLIAAVVAPRAILPIVLIFSILAWIAHRGVLLPLLKAPGLALPAAIVVAAWAVATIAWTIAPEATPPAALALAGACVLGGVAAVLMARGTPPPPTHWAVIAVAFAVVVLVIFNAAAGSAFVPGGVFVALTPVLLFPVAAALRTRFGRGEAVLWMAVAAALCVWSGGFAAVIALAVGFLAFLMGGLSSVAARVLLTLILLLLGLVLPLSAFLVGDALVSVSRDMFGAGNLLETRLGGWVDVVAAWRDAVFIGLGAAAVPLSGGGGGYLRILAETGLIGLAITIVALSAIVWSGVPRGDEGDATWRTQASAGTIGAALVLGFGYAGIWSPWWLGGLTLAAMILGACRPRPSGGASLGSIFDLAREDTGALAEDDPPPADEWRVDTAAVDDDPDARPNAARETFDEEPDAWEVEDVDDTRGTDDDREERFSFDRLGPTDGRKT